GCAYWAEPPRAPSLPGSIRLAVHSLLEGRWRPRRVPSRPAALPVADLQQVGSVPVLEAVCPWHGWSSVAVHGYIGDTLVSDGSGQVCLGHVRCPTALGSCPWRTRARGVRGARVRPSMAAHG